MLLFKQMNCRLLEYLEDNGKSPFAEWFTDLDSVVAARVDKYLRRLGQGSFGNSKAVGSGVFELKMDFGPGYRIYYGRDGETLIILLGGGDKSRQSHDIEQANRRWASFKRRRG